ncbi:unnamed protein product [Bursaphelenchus xylophilus]|uniref:(pine wood nematode) hypothetical protein n=1 Tax=Bursaphelenchus xylophilus TaxID=6326 RepID=A0A1I7STS7_BURXY|nr:unnamed protein product [Bursaphelenchus xylophilus]CAG9108023.1 unnamed protein product [Bursaphelenchus xylophilus]
MEPQRVVEQFEVIERYVTEGRRPLSSKEALNYIPTAEVHTTGDSYVVTGNEADRVFRDEAEKRYQVTGERDTSRNASFFDRSGPYPDQILAPENINQYGYDEHVVRTTSGGARIVETHGGGRIFDDPRLNSSSLVFQDRSLDTSGRPIEVIEPTIIHSSSSRIHNQPNAPQSILKNSDSRHFSSFEDNSLTRKDSYKQMQESQADNMSFEPASDATMISRDSKRNAWKKRSVQGGFCLQFKNYFGDLVNEIRHAEMTPAMICGLLLILLFLLFLIILFIIILRSAFAPYSVHSFLLFPPRCEECIKKNPALSTYRAPSKVYVHVQSPSRIDLEMIGNRPFLSNSFTALDFSSGYVAYADHSLTNDHGRHTTCFLMELDRNVLPSHAVVLDAVSNTPHEVMTDFGWQEYWQYKTQPIDANQAMSHFQGTVEDCVGAQWYLLTHTVHPRDGSCYDCYDFCLPDYAIQRTHKYADDATLGIRRLNCFRHYVPEWSKYRVDPDEEGGHWNYPRKQINTQRDERGQWVNWTPVSIVGQPGFRIRRR